MAGGFARSREPSDDMTTVREAEVQWSASQCSMERGLRLWRLSSCTGRRTVKGYNAFVGLDVHKETIAGRLLTRDRTTFGFSALSRTRRTLSSR